MRLNDDGITEVIEKIKSKFSHLRLANSTTNTYDGESYSAPIITLDLQSVTYVGNTITLTYRLGSLQANGETIDMSGLSRQLTGNEVLSSEGLATIVKTNLENWRWIYEIEVLR